MTTRWKLQPWAFAAALCFSAPAFAQEEPAPVAAEESSGEHLRELKTVEEAVHALKERVFRSKATLQLLSELVVEAAALEARLSLWHVDDLGAGYEITGIRYFLDGRSVYEWSAESGTPAPPRELEIRSHSAEVGPHTLQVAMDVRGGGGKVFNYVEDYAVTVQSSYQFDVESGRQTLLLVHATRKGGVKKAFLERPTLEYEIRSEAIAEEER
jgi:hypothetical protein